MASGWSKIREEIEAVLEGPPFELRRVKRGISELSGHGLSGAGNVFFHEGYLIAPRRLNRGERLELISRERRLAFEIYTGIVIRDDYDEGTDVLVERVERIIESLRDCNRYVPSAILVDTDGDSQFVENPEEPSQMFARIPMICCYHM